MNHIPNKCNRTSSLSEQHWEQELAWARASERALPTASAGKTLLPSWNIGGTVASICSDDALGKLGTSLLFGHFAFVRQCLNALNQTLNPLWRLLSREWHYNELLCWRPQAKGSGSSWPLQISWSGTHSYLRPSFDLFFSALVPEPTVLQAV